MTFSAPSKAASRQTSKREKAMAASPRYFSSWKSLIRTFVPGKVLHFIICRSSSSPFYSLEKTFETFIRDDGSNGSTPRTSIKSIQDSLSSFESMKSVAGNALAQINKQMITQKSTESKISVSSSPSRGRFSAVRHFFTFIRAIDTVVQRAQVSKWPND